MSRNKDIIKLKSKIIKSKSKTILYQQNWIFHKSCYNSNELMIPWKIRQGSETSEKLSDSMSGANKNGLAFLHITQRPHCLFIKIEGQIFRYLWQTFGRFCWQSLSVWPALLNLQISSAKHRSDYNPKYLTKHQRKKCCCTVRLL